jgi:hypothetical protein
MAFYTLLLAAATLLPRVVFSMTSQEFLLLHKPGDDGLAPLYGMETVTRIPDDYIIMFQPGYTLQEHFESIGMDLSNTTGFESTSYGYTAILDEVTLDSHIRQDPGVLLVEANRQIELIRPVENSYENGSMFLENQKREYTQATQKNAPYGLQMISAAGKLTTPISDYGEYDYWSAAGTGVNVYVFDTG